MPARRERSSRATTARIPRQSVDKEYSAGDYNAVVICSREVSRGPFTWLIARKTRSGCACVSINVCPVQKDHDCIGGLHGGQRDGPQHLLLLMIAECVGTYGRLPQCLVCA